MRFDYRIVFIITALLFTLSTSLTVINYFESMDSTRKQLKDSSLPLTIDNIYTEIQKQIIEPNLIASMMSHDTFMKDWLAHEENDVQQITQYLETIQNKYQMFTAFLVSEKSQNYYTANGLLEKIEDNNANNAWYFTFKKGSEVSEINIDYNKFMGQSLIMFINHKIYDEKYHMIGATGVGLQTSYINDMLKHFRLKYNFNVYFINDSGQVVISEQGVNELNNIRDIPELSEFSHDLISKAKVDNFTQSVKQAFYFNIFVSLVITLIITLIVLLYVRKIHNKLNDLASNDTLTGLPNRRTFNSQLENFLLLNQRHQQNLSILFIDVDDFKHINDIHGHDIGDKVLKEIAQTLKSTIRKSDCIARWGGEEFIILLLNTQLGDAELIAEQLRANIESNAYLIQQTSQKTTISLGITQVSEDDDIDSLFQRVDGALYQAKSTGKNRVAVSKA